MSKKILFLSAALIIGVSFFVGVRFSLAADPSITVLSPNGGETWNVGETKTIKWSISANGSNIVIQDNILELWSCDYSASCLYVGNINNMNGSWGENSYSWKIPNIIGGIEIQPNVNYTYKIKVRMAYTDNPGTSNQADKEISDISDSYFTVTASSQSSFADFVVTEVGVKYLAEVLNEIRAGDHYYAKVKNIGADFIFTDSLVSGNNDLGIRFEGNTGWMIPINESAIYHRKQYEKGDKISSNQEIEFIALSTSGVAAGAYSIKATVNPEQTFSSIKRIIEEGDYSNNSLTKTVTIGNSPAQPLEISNLTVSDITSNSASIKWDTNILAKSSIWYGVENTVDGRNISKRDDNYSTIQNIKLTYLSPNTTYYFEALSTNQSGVIKALKSQFTTSYVQPSKTCDDLKSSQANNFNMCSSEGFDYVCLNKDSGAFQGCTRNSYDDCIAHNVNAAQNILCPAVSVPTTPNLTVTNFKYGNINDQNNVSTQVEFDLVNAGSSAATFYLVAWNDTTNYPLTSELKSLAANQTVHIYLMNVNNISHLALGLNAINIKEVSSDSQTVYNSQDFTVNIKAPTTDTQITQITTNANLLTNDKMSEILAELNQLRSIVQEQQTQIKYLSSLLKDVQGISAASQAVLNNFITYGVDANTVKLGAGERAAVINSYKAAFDKLPQTEAELADVIKIANGRWPSLTNQTAENQAKAQFLKIYKRAADMNGANDNAAVTIMAYGLRQKAENRNLNSEVNGIKIFKAIYGHTPKTTEEWNAMQAITYSGATQKTWSGYNPNGN